MGCLRFDYCFVFTCSAFVCLLARLRALFAVVLHSGASLLYMHLFCLLSSLVICAVVLLIVAPSLTI